MQLIWLRSDLRVHDNTALTAAMQRGPTLAAYLLSPTQWRNHDDADCKVDFWLRNLVELEKALGKLNVPLLIREADTWDQAPEVLSSLCKQFKVEGLHLNEEYGINETRRDQAVQQAMQADGVHFTSHLDQLLFKPGSILTKTGNYFQVFTQFKKVCYTRLHEAMPRTVHTPEAQQPLSIKSDAIPDQVKGFSTPSKSLRDLWPAGEVEASRRIEAFADEQISYYKDERDFPAKPGTSQLSAYLVAGVISPRQCLHAALASNQGEFETGDVGTVTWINELLWREFYKHTLVGYPRVSRHRAFRPETEALKWRDAPEELLAWQEARTGLPIIDAAMRQLLETGWMHNRLRMVVAMFLTKNLLIDWREGERFFMRHLIDGDLAANNGGWQWSSSTGTDSAPYFRIFNPLSQSERFDPEGVFIKRWLPELADLNKKQIHDPASVGGLFGVADYPKPIVDLSKSRARALAAFKALPARQPAAGADNG
ncbi:deoxyribodipyrimidine photo-lyase [Pseudomonas syringae pv. actinidiae]|uniref:deoxyribodipyrimidine photo-lyase n=1 Tax=Pseudomonas syringae TaxID=317 RepID=UPI000BB584C5|nr:deoxyribodipyrimidine photo-lyase [Pseudomonas syringae]PBK49987.1 deoxyribodipyrimidine photo-lyase [Pseudomonas syringae pv. actinidiae]PBK55653.1 deoxyribodipyrimidine photo-lyase [Pseudomonas syringae pv. actinidiae]RJX46860.1 deoxyribodipyrimidine photo-lyase [Pseudomonas syringae pv. actinidiae]RJX53546.1 deoxyribodipyrimidine photo-lyase [Pseudomonas syringae pv. actinidiae]RJX55031.1 deoxyribodipyrimidine photo-lyase [Pseudomonas syringae pv. actinidiae]